MDCERVTGPACEAVTCIQIRTLHCDLMHHTIDLMHSIASIEHADVKTLRLKCNKNLKNQKNNVTKIYKKTFVHVV